MSSHTQTPRKPRPVVRYTILSLSTGVTVAELEQFASEVRADGATDDTIIRFASEPAFLGTTKALIYSRKTTDGEDA